jgi:hypothetical protein
MRVNTHFHLAALILAAMTLASNANAAVQTREYLKDKFQDGDIPTGQDFKDVIDSALNFSDDGLTIYRIGVDSGRMALRLDSATVIDGSLSYDPAGSIPPLAPNWAGFFGFLPLELIDTSSETHYGFLQMEMASGPLPPPPGAPGPVIHVQYLSWESQANTPLTTFVSTPELTSGIVWCIGAAVLPLFRRRRER